MSKFGTKQFADDFAKLMDAWNAMERIVTRDYPDLTADERYEITKRAMNAKLGLTK